MQTSHETVTKIALSPDEFQKLVSSHIETAVPVVVQGQGPRSETKFLGIVHGMTREDVDTLLRPMIEGLPAIGNYRIIVNQDEATKAETAAWVQWRG